MASAEKNKKLMRRRLVNAYLSSVTSISLVLLLVGIASMLLVNTKSVSDYFKENMQISVMLKPEVTDNQAEKYCKSIESEVYVRRAHLVSREEGRKEMEEMLGVGFLDVFEATPIPVSVDVTLKADYVSNDSLIVVKEALSQNKIVDEVVYQQTLVDALNANLGKISAILAIFIALLLFISFVLINNTVRINVFANRFTIHTMKLVGATKSFIRRPYMIQSVFQGLFAGVISIIYLIIILFIIKNEIPQMLSIFTLDLLLIVIAIVIVSGVIICCTSTWFVVNRLVMLKKDELYY